MANEVWVKASDEVTYGGRLFTEFGNGKAVVIHSTRDGGKLFIEGVMVPRPFEGTLSGPLCLWVVLLR